MKGLVYAQIERFGEKIYCRHVLEIIKGMDAERVKEELIEYYQDQLSRGIGWCPVGDYSYLDKPGGVGGSSVGVV